MTARRVTRIEGAPGEAWLVTGEPLPPPSGQWWPSPLFHLWFHDMAVGPPIGWMPLDPTAADS